MLIYMYSIYVHTVPNGKKYVGCTSMKPKKRWRNGNGYRTSHNKLFYEVILQYGWDNIKHEVIETTDNKKIAIQLEEYYTLLWRTNEPEFGYNIRVVNKNSESSKEKISNSLKGKHHTKERKEKISNSLKGKYKGENSPCYGKHHTKERKEKISNSLKGKYKGENSPFYGIHKTEEQKEKISNSLKGKPSKNRGTHRVYNEDGTFHMEI